jgi:hypothetical protein
MPQSASLPLNGSNSPALALNKTTPEFAATNGIASDSEPSPATPDAALAAFKLQGIFYGASRASAMINGVAVSRNDEVSGAKVLAIERQAVWLLFQGRTNILKLH